MKEITRLLASWSSATGEGDEQLRSYMLAVEDFDEAEVEAGITALIKGISPGVNPNFLPPPAVVGAEVRRQLHLRLRREELDRLSRPALPEPDIQHTAESRAKVRAMVERTVHGLTSLDGDESEPERRHLERWRKTNAYFDEPQGFEVGDPEGQADAA